MATLLVAALYFLSFSALGSVSQAQGEQLSVKQGEMIVLKCNCLGQDTTMANFTWTHHPSDTQQTWLSHGESYGDSLLVHRGRLVVLRASVERQGNYSCSLGNSNSTCWFSLTVSPIRQDVDLFTRDCIQENACKLRCPRIDIPPLLPLTATVWFKGNNRLADSFRGYFPNVAAEDGGVYTCRHSYLFHGRLYNHTRTTELQVTPDEFQGHTPIIVSPKTAEVYPVHLGSQLVVPCVGVVYNPFDNIYWLHRKSFVKVDQTLSIFSTNTTVETRGKERKITVSLVFQKVTEDQLSGNYMCKLESSQKYSNVTISLVLKALPVSVHMVVGLAVLFALLLVVSSILVFMFYRVHITLVLRDKLGFHGNTSDGKHYDAYVMTYKSQSQAALSEEDRRWMENVLEHQLGYRLCLHDRDAHPGEAVADAVMRCILQSHRVVLLPSSEDHPDLGFGLPSAIHATLVDKKSRLVLILTKATKEKEEEEKAVLVERSKDGGPSSLPESLRLLTPAGRSVTWGGPRSRPLSSSFWKHLRYHLAAPRKLKATLDSVC